nr:MAG TPA: hypothetical protein [Caudoviricetes sp.]
MRYLTHTEGRPLSTRALGNTFKKCSIRVSTGCSSLHFCTISIALSGHIFSNPLHDKIVLLLSEPS